MAKKLIAFLLFAVLLAACMLVVMLLAIQSGVPGPQTDRVFPPVAGPLE